MKWLRCGIFVISFGYFREIQDFFFRMPRDAQAKIELAGGLEPGRFGTLQFRPKTFYYLHP